MGQRQKLYVIGSLLGLLLFGLVLFFLSTPEGQAWDQALFFRIIALRTPGLNTLAEAITYLGNWQSMVVLSLLLLANGSWRKSYGIPVTGILVGITGVKVLLKWWIDRPRPEAVNFIIDQGGSSFPSGHAMTAMAVFLLLFVLLGRDGNLGKRKKPLMAVALVLAFVVGISRIWLGVHYPLDVIGGWCLAWTLLPLFIFGADHWQDDRKRDS